MPRQRVTISIPKEIVDWLKTQVKEGIYYNRSHAIEKCLKEKMNS